MFNFFNRKIKRIVDSIIDKMNKQTLDNINKLRKNSYITYVVPEINNQIMSYVVSTEELLREKEFSLCLLTEGITKSVFLNTEISELADAVKKGFGDESEGLEVADIVIRACNFLCADETFDEYKSITEVLNHNIGDSEIIKVAISLDRNKTTEESKFIFIENMMKQWFALNNSLNHFIDSLDKNKNIQNMMITQLWGDTLLLICMCDLYADMFLEENLHFYVRKKMDINSQRPVRYNISEKVKS